MRIVWEEKKNKENIRKHRISFEEAQTVFHDPNGKLIDDPDHSDDEERFIILGLSKMLHLLVVCHCYREDDETIRIITARKATKKEAKYYGGY
jgi:uncharacterized DUF497 family protein